MSREDRLKYILRNAIIAYEFELESQDYQSEDVIHSVVLNELEITEEEYREIMRYHFKKPAIFSSLYGRTHICDHPVYNRCTLYEIGDKGLAVIQQRFDPSDKSTKWTEVDPWFTDVLYLHPKFKEFFDERSGEKIGDIYPTVTLRQIMWALKMKPLKRERWETVFDRRDI